MPPSRHPSPEIECLGMLPGTGAAWETASKQKQVIGPIVTEPPNYDGPQAHVIAIMTSDSRTYVHHNLKGLLSSEQDL
jgi:hypothetical protein